MKKRARATKPTKVKAAVKRMQPKAAKGATKAASKGGTYTPTPIQGIGWAPFRYPLS